MEELTSVLETNLDNVLILSGTGPVGGFFLACRKALPSPINCHWLMRFSQTLLPQLSLSQSDAMIMSTSVITHYGAKDSPQQLPA